MSDNSYYDALAVLPAEDILSSSELLTGAANELLERKQPYELMFRKDNVDGLVVAYHTDVAPALDERIEKVAEYGEIPVGDPAGERKRKFAELDKFAVGLRVSYEQRKFSPTGHDIQRELDARVAEIRRLNSDAAVGALAAADVETLPINTKWNLAGADPVADLWAADDLLAGAEDEAGNRFHYSAGFVWANLKTLSALKRHKSVRDLYTGDMAHANPIFAGIGEQPLIAGQFKLVADQAIPDGEVYVFADSTGPAIGTLYQTGDPQFTDWYSEKGDSRLGGATMSWRSDWVHFRAMAVRAPKAVVKLTGAI